MAKISMAPDLPVPAAALGQFAGAFGCNSVICGNRFSNVSQFGHFP
ncbi:MULTISPECIES: hypothetical protein [unclassified Mesorhizobium]|nr:MULTISPECIES: hypothetical protein [unclassified Mesorhizobium]MDF3177822.1 hypothetical protein [Mesorhizobium sp. P17.1]